MVPPKRNRILQGGVRERVFFPKDPDRGPTLNKLPLVRWNRRYVYVNSTHSALPPRLNDQYDGPGDPRLSGVLLHGKFLPDSVLRAAEELDRRQHYGNSQEYRAYHAGLHQGVQLWCSESREFRDWRQLEDLGLISRGNWP